jgi:hypothetical protein
MATGQQRNLLPHLASRQPSALERPMAQGLATPLVGRTRQQCLQSAHWGRGPAGLVSTRAASGSQSQRSAMASGAPARVDARRMQEDGCGNLKRSGHPPHGAIVDREQRETNVVAVQTGVKSTGGTGTGMALKPSGGMKSGAEKSIAMRVTGRAGVSDQMRRTVASGNVAHVRNTRAALLCRLARRAGVALGVLSAAKSGEASLARLALQSQTIGQMLFFQTDTSSPGLLLLWLLVRTATFRLPMAAELLQTRRQHMQRLLLWRPLPLQRSSAACRRS